MNLLKIQLNHIKFIKKFMNNAIYYIFLVSIWIMACNNKENEKIICKFYYDENQRQIHTISEYKNDILLSFTEFNIDSTRFFKIRCVGLDSLTIDSLSSPVLDVIYDSTNISLNDTILIKFQLTSSKLLLDEVLFINKNGIARPIEESSFENIKGFLFNFQYFRNLRYIIKNEVDTLTILTTLYHKKTRFPLFSRIDSMKIKYDLAEKKLSIIRLN